jgi:predicted Rossmann fold flavoprotein
VRCEFDAERLREQSGASRQTGADGFEVRSAGGEAVTGEAVVVATGVGPFLADTGHAWVESAPVLGPLRTETEPIRGLSGVRVRCAATLYGDGDAEHTEPIATERGELLFRDYGVSGIMVFDLSRYRENACSLSIDFAPDATPQELEAMLTERCSSLSWRSAETFFTGMLHDRVGRAVLRAAGVTSDAPVASLPVAKLACQLKEFRLGVLGMGDEKQAQVTRGGASVAEFDPETMGSRLVDGLFAAGEVLDVDGRSGGYNLHWAWASGIVAGEAAAHAARARAARGDRETADPA